MARITLSIIAAIFLASVAHASMDCSFGTSDNKIDKFLQSCPGLFDSQSKSYCCVNLQSNSMYCCDLEEFTLKTGLTIIVPAIIAVIVIISLVVLCISCLCCTCCPWYRRRHRGTVYGNLQTPTAVHVIQPSPAHPVYVGHQVQSQPPAYVVTAAPAMPQQPPQYTPEGYTKQAPYNPNYRQ